MSAITLPPLKSGDAESMMEKAKAASDFLKALSNETRLMILCLLVEGERSVTEMEAALELRQPTISQQLARLRADSLVTHRREGKTIYYSLASDEVREVMALLYRLFCQPEGRQKGA